MCYNNLDFMKSALAMAKEAYDDNEVPVGAVIVRDGEIISQGRNRREKEKNALLHAEIDAINNACKALGGWRLWNCELYVTLEPCPMCGWAILQSRIKSVYFGSYDTNYGAFSSKIDLRTLIPGTKLNVYGGIMELECDMFLDEFFKKIR